CPPHLGRQSHFTRRRNAADPHERVAHLLATAKRLLCWLGSTASLTPSPNPRYRSQFSFPVARTTASRLLLLARDFYSIQPRTRVSSDPVNNYEKVRLMCGAYDRCTCA